MSSHYRKQLEEWLHNLPVTAETVFDVGGSQLPVKDRVKEWNVKNYRIVDLKDPHIKKVNVDYDIDLNKSQYLEENADVVFCLEVMEYIFDPITAIHNLRNMTKDGGILYITFPYYYPPHEPLTSDYLRYTMKGAIKLLELSGFNIEEITFRESKGHGFNMLNTENALRASKNATFAELNSLGFIIKARAI